MIQIKTHEYDLPLKHTFRISRAAFDVQPTLIVELSDGIHSGFGEATTNAYYDVTFESMKAALDQVRPMLELCDPDQPEQLFETAASQLRDHPFAQCALDEAAHDLCGKRAGKSLIEMWGLTKESCPPSNFTIGIDSIDSMVEKLREVPGWPVYKIKLGTDHDIEIIRRLRGETDATFRVDANCGWSADETIANSQQLAELGVEFIEQPLPAEAWEQMQRVHAESALPIIADESCIVEADVDRCAGYFHGINIKLMKCGGLTPARRMIQRARDLQMKVMVGCMTESTVGISAIAQLLPLLDYVDMDGAELLSQDIATGARVESGVCRFSEQPGTGVALI